MSIFTHFYFIMYIYYNVKENNEKPKENMIRVLSSSKKERPSKNIRWLVEVFVTTLGLSIMFALIAELMLSHTNLALALILILFLMIGNIFFDIIGMAVTACNVKPLLELSKKNERGASIALRLVKNADKVSCICSDVVGDICSILCGACGVSFAAILLSSMPSVNSLILSILVNAIIASTTITAKAIGKTYAINYSTKIVLSVARKLSVFVGRK